MKYHYTNAQNQPVGPVEFSELGRLAAEGIINDQTAIIPDGGQTWTNYGAVRQGASANAAAEAIAAGMGRASTAIRQFSWGNLIIGLLATFISFLTLPWTVITSAASELAGWGRDRALPLKASDAPVLTFLVVVLRNTVLVVGAFLIVVFACLSLAGQGPFYMSYYDSTWQAKPALGGFFGGLLVGYFALAGIALSFELTALIVRIANDVKTIAKR